LSTPKCFLRPYRATRKGIAAFVLFALVAGLLGLCPAARPALAEDEPSFKIVVHPDNAIAKVSRQVLSSLFLKQVTRWDDGEASRPVDLKSDSATRRRFSERVLNRSVAAVKNYWQQRIFSGGGVPPPELESDQAVLAYVTKHRGAVGYVSSLTDIGKARSIRLE
jgi:hypothetical protein